MEGKNFASLPNSFVTRPEELGRENTIRRRKDMDIRKPDLKLLKGCRGCNKKCTWNASVITDESIQEQMCSDKYICNSTSYHRYPSKARARKSTAAWAANRRISATMPKSTGKPTRPAGWPKLQKETRNWHQEKRRKPPRATSPAPNGALTATTRVVVSCRNSKEGKHKTSGIPCAKSRASGEDRGHKPREPGKIL
jgi:hypothetical protein